MMRRVLATLAYAGGLILAWEIVATISQQSVLPELTQLISASFESLGYQRVLASRQEFEPSLWQHVAATSVRCVLCIVIGLVLGIGAAILSVLSRTFASLFNAFVDASRSVPPLLFVPVFVVFFGVGEGAALLGATVYSITSIAVFARASLNGLPPSLVDQAKLFGGGKWGLATRVLLPQIVQSILPGLRLSIALIVGIVLVIEYFIGGYGLGRVLTLGLYANSTELIFVCVFWAALITVLLEALAAIIFRSALPAEQV